VEILSILSSKKCDRVLVSWDEGNVCQVLETGLLREGAGFCWAFEGFSNHDMSFPSAGWSFLDYISDKNADLRYMKELNVFFLLSIQMSCIV
jgi:hypothetical protein